MVQAVRGAQALMLRLVQHSAQTMELAMQGADAALCMELSASLELLERHKAAMLQGYGLALLETFGQPGGAVVRHPHPSALAAPAELLPGAGSRLGAEGDFTSLSLVDDATLQAQLAHHHFLQAVAPQVEIALAELDALISSAQGMDRVQPERNPLRPQNYVRALQRVIDDTGVPSVHAACWAGFMREQLGALLVSEYSRAAQFLRDQGVTPAAYGMAAPASAPDMPSSRADGWHSHDTGSHGNWRAPSHYGDAMAQSRAYGQQLPPHDDPAQRLAGVLMSDPRWIADRGEMPVSAQALAPVSAVAAISGPAVLQPVSIWHGTDSMAAALPEGWTSLSRMALDSVQDAQFEQLVRAVQVSGGEGMALHTLQRMMRFMANDARLMPSVQNLVLRLEPVLQQLVLRDARFFEDRNHPARLLLDELTARSLWFPGESAPGYSQFMQIADSAVARLAAEPQADASVFGLVLQQLREDWAGGPGSSGLAVGSASAAAPLSAALRRAGAAEHDTAWAEATMPKAEQIASAIRRLPSAQGVPEDILDFATGPWAEVIASAHRMPGTSRDPGGYLALVPSLLWSVSSHASRDSARLVALAPRLQARVSAGLRSVGRTSEEIQAFAARLAGLHQDALDAAVSISAAAAPPEESPAPVPARSSERVEPPVAAAMPEAVPQVAAAGLALSQVTAHLPESLFGAVISPVQPDAVPVSPAEPELPQAPELPQEPAPRPSAVAVSEDWPLGTWAELSSTRQNLRTQLTWVSPQQTLFLFTAADGSTQSMTRRMRDKLLAQGQLRRLDAAD